MSTRSSVATYNALLVDDDPGLRQAMARSFRNVGFRCELASNGLEAQRLLSDRGYDVVITDLKMPEMNGHRLAVELLARADRPVVIVVTGLTEQKLENDLRTRGVDDILFKPVDYAELATRAQSLIDARCAKNKTRDLRALAVLKDSCSSEAPESRQQAGVPAAPHGDSGSNSAGSPAAAVEPSGSICNSTTAIETLPSTTADASARRPGLAAVVSLAAEPVAHREPAIETLLLRLDDFLLRVKPEMLVTAARRTPSSFWAVLTFVAGVWLGWFLAVCAR